MTKVTVKDWRDGLHSAFVPHAPVDEVNDKPSLTRQDMMEDCDINVLMDRFKDLGATPFSEQRVPQYLDLTIAPDDLAGAMRTFMEADQAFSDLPAVVRKEFDNDALRFVEYASDPGNLDKLREWGLAPPKAAPPAPIEVRVVPGELPGGGPVPGNGGDDKKP